MKQISKHLLNLGAIICLLFGLPSVPAAETKTIEIDQVEDGDTILAKLNGKSERLQLIGIDAPEDTDNAKLQRDLKVTGLGTEELLSLGREATAHLRSLVQSGDKIEVSGAFEKRDRYGRIPVVVKDQTGRSLNELMVEEGYATAMRKGEIEEELKARLQSLESEAITHKRGLWGKSHKAAMAWSGR